MRSIFTLCFLVALSTSQLVASHWAGGHITYRYIGDSTNVSGEYLVEVTIYQSAWGIGPVSLNSIPLTIEGCNESVQLNPNLSMLLPPANRQYFLDSTAWQVDSSLHCINGIYEYVMHRYRGTVILNTNCSDYLFSLDFSCCGDRFVNGEIRNLYLEARLDNLQRENSLPKPKDELFLVSRCTNKLTSIGGFHDDEDGDYNLVTAKPNPNIFAAPFTAYNPFDSNAIQPFTIDSITGRTEFVATEAGEYALSISYTDFERNPNTNSLVEQGSYLFLVPVKIGDTCKNSVSYGPELTMTNGNKMQTDSCGLNYTLLRSNLGIAQGSVDTNATDFSVFSFRRQAPEPVRSVEVVDPYTLKINYFFPLTANDTIRIISKIGADGNRVLNACGFDQSEGDTLYQIVAGCANVALPEQDPYILTLYPNPSNGWVQVEAGAQPNTFALEIRNSQGQKVLVRNNYKGEKLDLSTLSSGLYWISAYGTKGLMGTQKLLLQSK